MSKQLDLFGFEGFESESKQQCPIYNDFGKIVLSSKVQNDEYTDYISQAFDLKTTDTSVVKIPYLLNIKNLGEWNIGVICGSSGSGKSTILKHLCEENGGSLDTPIFDNSKTVISNFGNLQPKDAAQLLSAMGLSSVPTWIRPFNVLSNGERYRAQLAKKISETSGDTIIFVDEYTSVVDRNVAMAMSNALQKYVRKHNKRIILATCHYDIFEWLRPDWIYDLNKGGTLERGDYLRQPRPKIELQVYRTTTDTWEMFKKHHYMTSELNTSSACYVFTWNNKLVAFVGVLPFPNGALKDAYRGTRTVVLPDYQGLGIGSKITDFIAGVYKASGKLYFTKTVNPALGEYRKKSPLWKASSSNMKERTEQEVLKENNILGGLTRPSYCYKFIGEPIYGCEKLILPIDQILFERNFKNQMVFSF